MSNSEGIIYKAVNRINGKVYIGQTCQSFRRRINEHKRDALVRNCNFSFHKAIRKYGIENFEWEILTVAGVDALDALERGFVTFYKSSSKRYGYNLTVGGSVLRGKQNPFFGRKHSIETRKLISDRNKGCVSHNKGKSLSKITRDRISQSLKSRGGTVGVNNPMYGKTHSNQSKELMRQKALKREWLPTPTIKKYLVDHPDGYREVVFNLNKFCRERNLNHSNLYATANNPKLRCKGFKCCRLYDFEVRKT